MGKKKGTQCLGVTGDPGEKLTSGTIWRGGWLERQARERLLGAEERNFVSDVTDSCNQWAL